MLLEEGAPFELADLKLAPTFAVLVFQVSGWKSACQACTDSRLNVRTTYHAAHMLNRGIMSSLPASMHAVPREGRLTHRTGLPALSACHC